MKPRRAGLKLMRTSGQRSRSAKRKAPRKAKAASTPAEPSTLELKAWVDALSAAPAGAITESQILSWVEGPLRRFFPFERFLGSYGRLSVSASPSAAS
jgi:hypothetical protein